MSYIDDVVDVWIRVIETPTEKVIGQKFFVGPGQEHTIEDLARLCHDAAGSAAPIEYVDYRPGEQGQREAFTTEKARRVLGVCLRNNVLNDNRLNQRYNYDIPHI